ncbi:glucose PTS transporter subunit IIA [Serratia marcescens]|nr:glucose PTS transporter subunit IIA [Serratia marcescens]UYY68551.1 glucose PTS transporter subunit IIA [Serratia marcescens]
MGLFDKLKSLVSDDKKDMGTIEIVAPLSGEIVNIEDVPDVVFAEKIVGDGIAIKPAGNKMVAPVDGTIGKIFETNHAFSIESDSGIELFVHFGIDTVELKGEGFKTHRRRRPARQERRRRYRVQPASAGRESQVDPDAGRYLQHGRDQRADQTVRQRNRWRNPDHPHQEVIEVIANEQ